MSALGPGVQPPVAFAPASDSGLCVASLEMLAAKQFKAEGPLPADFAKSLDTMAYVFRAKGVAPQAEPQELVVIASDPEHAAACEGLLRGHPGSVTSRSDPFR